MKKHLKEREFRVSYICIIGTPKVEVVTALTHHQARLKFLYVLAIPHKQINNIL